MGALEMHQRLEQLKRSMHRVHLYSQGEAQPLPGSRNPADLTRVPSSLVLCLAAPFFFFFNLVFIFKVFIVKMNIHKTGTGHPSASATVSILPSLLHSHFPPFFFLEHSGGNLRHHCVPGSFRMLFYILKKDILLSQCYPDIIDNNFLISVDTWFGC